MLLLTKYFVSLITSIYFLPQKNKFYLMAGFVHTEVNSEKLLSMSAFEHLKYLESLNLEDTPLSAEVIPPLASFAALKYLYLKSDFLSDPALHALSAASNLIHLGFCGNILSSSGLLQFVPPATLCVLDLSGCWILTGDAISTFCKRHPTIELRHELMQEVQANFVGGSQLRKPRRRRSPHVKAEVGNSFAGPSRLHDICFVGEDARYSVVSLHFLLEIQSQLELCILQYIDNRFAFRLNR